MGILDGQGARSSPAAGAASAAATACTSPANGASVVVNDIDRGEAREGGGRDRRGRRQGGRERRRHLGAREGARALIQRCVDEFGAIHALVNNAGNVRDRSFLKMTRRRVRRACCACTCAAPSCAPRRPRCA